MDKARKFFIGASMCYMMAFVSLVVMVPLFGYVAGFSVCGVLILISFIFLGCCIEEEFKQKQDSRFIRKQEILRVIEDGSLRDAVQRCDNGYKLDNLMNEIKKFVR